MRQGDAILHYRIEKSLGKGGMGEVYLAEDTRLKRKVALKVLPEDLARDPVLLQRFRVEAEAAAKLNHPNIAQVFATEEARLEDDRAGKDGERGDSGRTINFITMEYVSGRPLHEHLSGKPLPLDTFFDWFLPIADALDHAHERGVAHRDLKPANVMVTEDGAPKVLDFGLARITPGGSDDGENDAPTMSLTQAGTVIGTPAYMSPEQATGSHGDHRSDIFSLGVMMYEALTGSRPFTGDHYVSIISSTLKDEPEAVGEYNRDVPPSLNRIVRRCLGKDPRARYQSILDVGHDLADSREEFKSAPAAGFAVGASKAGSAESILRSRSVLAACVLGLAAAVLGLAAVLGWFQVPAPEPVRKFQVTLDNLGRGNVAISPDGTRLAYVYDKRLWVRSLDQVEGREIPGTDDVNEVFWSPDSRYIGYLVRRTIWKVMADGGGQVRICDLPDLRLTGISWGGDGQILFSMVGRSSGVGLYSVTEHGGDPVLLMRPDIEGSELGYLTPVSLAEYNLRLYAVARTSDDMEEIAVLSEKYRG
ncbi:MAG: protein kinase, partial [Gemmatimonadetes bacterium]|nr:protein kinase [Gemmatimonadota bacterium]